MSDTSKIEWTDATWNPFLGCSKASPGCKGCYAIRQVHRMAHNPNPKMAAANAGLVTIDGKNWTGKVRFIEDRLGIPAQWRRPKRIFVNSLSDLFHPTARFEDIHKVFAVMQVHDQHTYQILTKHPDNMLRFLIWLKEQREMEYAPGCTDGRAAILRMPAPNILLGCSVENQNWALLRWAPMGTISAMGWATFVSYEPALGPVDWSRWEFLKWLISGGESGPGARLHHPDWHRDTRDFCVTHEIPYFFKQWGAYTPYLSEIKSEDDKTWNEFVNLDGTTGWAAISKADEVSVTNWCGDIKEGMVCMERVGKKKAGRMLDGRQWSEFPKLAVRP